MRDPDKVTLKQKGTAIIFHEEIPDTELTSKDILTSIREVESEIGKAQGQIAQMQSQIPQIENAIEKNSSMLKKLKHHEDWAITVQESKAKALTAEVYEECRLKVDAEYKNDPTMSDEHNGLQKFKQLEFKIATHTKVSSELDKDIITKYCFTEPTFNNPWM